MDKLIFKHEGIDYSAEPCCIEEVSTDPYNFRIRLTGVDGGWSMLFTVINLEKGHEVMDKVKNALTDNFNVYRAELTEGKVAFLLKTMSGNVVGITSAANYFWKDPVFREPLGV